MIRTALLTAALLTTGCVAQAHDPRWGAKPHPEWGHYAPPSGSRPSYYWQERMMDRPRPWGHPAWGHYRPAPAPPPGAVLCKRYGWGHMACGSPNMFDPRW